MLNMEKIKFSKEMNLQVRARFIAKGADAPLHGSKYTVRLFDRDFLEDTSLGESKLDANGVVHFSFAAARLNKGFLDDTMPDFFFVLYKHDEVIFKTPTMENVNTEAIEQYRKGVGEIIDLGTFLVDA